MLPREVHTRRDILLAAQKLSPSFKPSQLANIINKAIKTNSLIRIGHNQYLKASEAENKLIFEGHYSLLSHEIISLIPTLFPLLQWQIWELFWLNEFVNHLITRNTIFVEVEYEGCDFVFSALNERYPGKVLLNPTAKELSLYGENKTIVVRRLISEAPAHKKFKHQAPLEKLIVDLFSNHGLLISKGDYPSAIEEMFSKYHIDTTAMMRYARRRNKADLISNYIKNETNIELRI